MDRTGGRENCPVFGKSAVLKDMQALIAKSWNRGIRRGQADQTRKIHADRLGCLDLSSAESLENRFLGGPDFKKSARPEASVFRKLAKFGGVAENGF